jgi:predicted NAD/FAD-dependent oxidoreductase
MKSVAIIGAGLAGLACARRLHDAGFAVSVFDKGRGVGGRMATRRVETSAGVARFDHGAQYFTARSPAFRSALDGVAEALAQWPVTLLSRRDGTLVEAAPEARFTGMLGMNAVAKAFAQGLDVTLSTRIVGLQRDAAAWTVQTEQDAHIGPFDALIVAVPAEQVAALISSHETDFAAEADAARTAPCWTGLFAFPASRSAALCALRLDDHPILAWIACDRDRPGRLDGDLVNFVVHARADWSADNLERTPEEVLPILRSALEPFFVSGAPAEPIVAQAHRWRYAQVTTPAQTPFRWDPELRLGLCGDWRIGARVEAAWTSGHELAGAMLALRQT